MQQQNWFSEGLGNLCSLKVKLVAPNRITKLIIASKHFPLLVKIISPSQTQSIGWTRSCFKSTTYSGQYSAYKFSPVEAFGGWNTSYETHVITCRLGAQRWGCPWTSSQLQSHDPYSWWPQEPHTQECRRTSKSSYLVRSFWQSQNQSEK